MDPARWQQIERLYHAALTRQAAERASYLAEACAGDEPLRQEVQALLAMPATTERFLDVPAIAVAAEMVADPAAATLIGQRLGVYHLQERIGAGGMGEVYRARDTRLGRDVAIKILSRAFTGDPERLARFEREARVLAALNHPHIAVIHGVEDGPADAGRSVRGLVLELVEGETLAERVARSRVAPQEALEIARQIAEALEAAHERGIVHRDLKPANIKITRDGHVKVLDFGLAKAVADGPNRTSGLTMTVDATSEGLIVGTAAYMSPEQARGQAVDTRTDIWAFGCVLYETLTGCVAFAGNTVSDTIAAILDREPDWTALHDVAPPDVVRLVRRCLTKDAHRRLHDIADARIDIEEAMNSLDGSRQTTSVPIAVGVSARRRLLRERVVWVLGGVLLSLAGLWALSPGRSVVNADVVELSVFPPKGATFPFEMGAPWPSVSPDGRQLAFVAVTPDGQQQLWMRSLGSATLRPLAGTEGAARPFWSPDSQAIGFFANGKLWRVNLPTGSPQPIADVPYLGGMSATWGRAGVIVFAHVGGLYRVSAAGGAASRVVEGQASSPVFLPDGQHFLYVLEKRPKKEDTRICTGSLDGTESRCVVNVHSSVKYGAPGYLLFAASSVLRAQAFDPGRQQLSGETFPVAAAQIVTEPVWRPPAFSVSDNGVLAYHPGAEETQLVWFDRSGARLGTIGPIDEYGNPGLSSDERRIVFSRRDQQSDNLDLWQYDLGRSATSRFTFDPAEEHNAVFSPDGQRVVFASDRPESPAIYQKATSGAGPEDRLVTSNTTLNPVDWSSDGRFILYQQIDSKTSWDLFAVSLSGDRRPLPVVQTEHGEREGRFSPDVRWIAYDSTESGRRDVWIQPFPPTGSKWQISTAGGFSPRWRGDGKELYYVAADGKLMSVAISAGSTLEFDAPKPLFQTMFREGAYGSYAVSRDGQRFLLNVPPAPADVTPITVVVNWTAALRQ